MRAVRRGRRGGFALLPVVLVLALLASVAYLMTRESATGIALVASAQQSDRARYAAEAALHHASWQVEASNCDDFGDVSATPFGSGGVQYSATVSPNSGSPVTLVATGTLADGTVHTLTRSGVAAYETPPPPLLLQPDAAAGKDTYLYEWKSGWNFGTSNSLWVSNQFNDSGATTLLEFDVSAIPAGAEIRSAVLELRQSSPASNGGTIGVRAATSAWVEGAEWGATGASSWNERDVGEDWGRPGGDFESSPVATRQMPNGFVGWLQWDVTSLVGRWVAGTQQNLGLALVPEAPATHAEFDSSDATVPANRPRLGIVYACECGQVCGAGGASGNLLLVVGDAGSLANEDSDRKALMESWGYAVTLIDDGADEMKFDTDAAANDVVYVTASVVGGTLADKLTGSSTPIVNEFAGKLDNFGFSSSTTLTLDADTFSKSDATHYVTSPFGGAAIGVFGLSLAMPVPSGTLAPDLQALAVLSSFGTGTLPGLAALDIGAQRWDGNPAPARRVHLPFGPAETSQLTADGLTLMKRAIEWAAGAGGTAGPIAHWKLDEGSGPTAADSVGGNDATLVGGAPSWVTGSLGGALDFDGVDDYAITNSDFTPPPVGTVTFWIQVSGPPAQRGRVLGIADDFEIRHESTGSPDAPASTLAFDLGDDGTNQGFWTTTTIDTPGRWYHIAAAYDTTTDAYVVYVDGVLETSGTYASDLYVPAAGLLSLGARTGSGENFDGVLDDVRIYDRALSASEIAELAVQPPLTGDYLDEWNIVAYDGSDGAIDWSATPWQELGDADGPTSGRVRVLSASQCASSNCLRIGGTEVSLAGRGVSREANLEGVSSAQLTFTIAGGGPVKAGLVLSVSDDGGASWTGLQKYEIGAGLPSTPMPQSFDISAFASATTQVRFVGFETPDDTAYGFIDDVRIAIGAGGGGGDADGGGPAPVYESFEEHIDADPNSASISVAKPAETAAGDLLVAVVVTDGNNQSTLVADDPEWNLLTVDAQGNSSTTGVWWKVAGDSDPSSYSFSWGGGARSYSWIMRFSGNDPTDPIHAWQKLGENSTASPVSPAVVTTVADTLVLRIGGFDDDDITIGDPGMAGHTPITMQKSNTGTGTVSGGAAYVAQYASGDSGTANFALTASEQSRTVTLAIRPAP